MSNLAPRIRNLVSHATAKLLPHACQIQLSSTGCSTSNLAIRPLLALTGSHHHHPQQHRSLASLQNTDQSLKTHIFGPSSQRQPAQTFVQATSNGSASFATSTMPRVLVTFDVDGTLMRAVGEEANKLHKKAFSYAMKEVFGVDGTIDAIHHHGSTDPMVLINTLKHYGHPREDTEPKIPQMKEKMIEYARAHTADVGDGLELLPGVKDLLEALANHPRCLVGLVTGNLEEIAWMKMKALGILPYFSHPNFGGFGSDHFERGELVKLAARKAATLFPDGDPISLKVHVGDTPADIMAAEFGDALAVGLTTGVFSREELDASVSGEGKAIILEGLEDTKVFLDACKLG